MPRALGHSPVCQNLNQDAWDPAGGCTGGRLSPFKALASGFPVLVADALTIRRPGRILHQPAVSWSQGLSLALPCGHLSILRQTHLWPDGFRQVVLRSK